MSCYRVAIAVLSHVLLYADRTGGTSGPTTVDARENGSRDFHVLLLINMSRGSAGRRDGKVDQILQGLTCLCGIVSLDASDISFRLKIQETILTGITR